MRRRPGARRDVGLAIVEQLGAKAARENSSVSGTVTESLDKNTYSQGRGANSAHRACEIRPQSLHRSIRFVGSWQSLQSTAGRKKKPRSVSWRLEIEGKEDRPLLNVVLTNA